MDAVTMRHLAQALVRDTLGRTGRTVRDIEITVDWDGDDVLLRRAHIGHEWSGDRGLGHPLPVRARIKGRRGEARFEAAVTRFVERAIALSDRQRAIAPHLEDDRQPAWSVLMEPCALAVIRYAGWSDADLLSFHRPQSDRYTVDDTGYRMAPGVGSMEVAGEVVMLRRLGLSGGVLRAGELRFGPKGGQAWYRGGRTPCMEIATAGVPETMLGAMAGRPLEDVLRHPATAGCGTSVTSARQATAPDGVRRLTLNLARRPVPMAPAPAGMDTTWLDVLARN